QRRRADATGESSLSEAYSHKQKLILTAAMGRCIKFAWREYVFADRNSLRGPFGPSPSPDRPTGGVPLMRPLVLKLGGELIESPEQRQRIAGLAASIAANRPLVVVHGGGRAVDAELARRQIAPKKVDGLRITDAATLDAVVAVLAGSTNTALVAALVATGINAVGLTRGDAGVGRARRVAAHTSTAGVVVDLGLVGDPTQADPGLLQLLVDNGYVPVVASLGYGADDDTPGQILNVNADVMACRIAA